MRQAGGGRRYSGKPLVAGVVVALIVLALLWPFTCSVNSSNGDWFCSNFLGLTLPGFSGGRSPHDPSLVFPMVLALASGVAAFSLVSRRSNSKPDENAE